MRDESDGGMRVMKEMGGMGEMGWRIGMERMKYQVAPICSAPHLKKYFTEMRGAELCEDFNI